MSEDILSRIDTYFSSPLKEGEKRKIMYLFDKDESYNETIAEWCKSKDAIQLLNVTDHNFFLTNYLIESEKTDKHLFLYFCMDRPPIEENPLLDVLLYSEELKVDEKSQLYLTLGIDPDNAELTQAVDQFPVFFRAKSRIQQFKRLFDQSPFKTSQVVEYSVFASLVKAPSADWMAILIELFEESAEHKEDKWDQLVKFGDDSRFWQMVDELTGYNQSISVSGSVSVKELMHYVFFTYLSTEMDQPLPKAIRPYVLHKSNPVVVFMNRWMNTKDKENAYYFVSTVIESGWAFDDLFGDLPSQTLANIETFKWFDLQLIKEIVQSIHMQTGEMDRLIPLLDKRRNTIWYEEFRTVYHVLKWAIQLNHFVEESESSLCSLIDSSKIWQLYSESAYHVDQAYRKLYEYYDELSSAHKELVVEVKDQMERLYVNQYLRAFNDKWDAYYLDQTVFNYAKLQAHFYQNEVKPYVANDRRIVVLISDGLRYEAGKELYLELTKEKKFNGEIDWMQTELPSITSIGMASLLPHQALQFKEDGQVLADGLSTRGIKNREAVLQKSGHPEAVALKATDISEWNQKELREHLYGKKLIYIYHDKVDAIGDNAPTEQEVFAATKDSIDELKQLMIRLTNELSVTSFLVTADHGYLYTRGAIPKSAKVSVKNSEEAWIKNKRFILLENAPDYPLGLTFSLSERLDSSGYISVPRGMNRFALQGGGNQYVHGGHLPQEMMVPLLRIKTERGRNEIPEVGVSLISQTRTLTTNVVWLDFLQVEPVSEEKKEKRLTLYFEDEQGRKISNEISLIADRVNPASNERVFTEKLVLLNEQYDSMAPYYFVMENENDPTDVVKERFKLDLLQ